MSPNPGILYVPGPHVYRAPAVERFSSSNINKPYPYNTQRGFISDIVKQYIYMLLPSITTQCYYQGFFFLKCTIIQQVYVWYVILLDALHLGRLSGVHLRPYGRVIYDPTVRLSVEFFFLFTHYYHFYKQSNYPVLVITYNCPQCYPQHCE